MRADQPTELWASFPGAEPGNAAAPGVLQPGRVLAGRYRLDARIGQGGMGVVYRATDLRTSRPVAVKALFVPGGGGGEVHRFQREFRALARLQHPHVISVHDYNHGEGVPYYVMEYVAGVDLHRLRQDSGGQLPVDLVVELLGQLCGALAYVHGQGIVHRDLKPSNVMVVGHGGPEPRVKLMDFGLAQVSDVTAHLTQSGMLLGTVLYMAPEQAQGLPVDRRADLYSLGVVLYELLGGRPPFTGDTPVNIILQHITQTPVPLPELRPEVPPPLAAVVARLLAKRPGERYASADEVWKALRDPAAGTSLAAPAAPVRADVVFRAGLVGREAELQQLGGWLAAAWQGNGRFVLLEGEAGVGKSRLTAELAGQARLRGGRRLSGACYEREALPYSPVVAPLQEALAHALAENEAEGLIGGLEADLARLMPQLTLPAGALPQPEIDPGQARLRLFDAVTQLLLRLAARRPLLFVVEDLHWADAGTLELLHYLVRNSAGRAPVLFVGTSRREERAESDALSGLLQGLRREKLLATLELQRLTLDATRALLAGLLALDDPPAELVERIYRESEGNPFFVEEVLKAQVEEGALVQQGGRWMLAPAGAGALSSLIPESVADVIRRRLGQVTAAGRQVLDGAAVLGREFAFDALRHALGGDEDALLDVLDDLLRARLLEEARSAREDRYRFAHAKIQEVLYAELSGPRRRKLHRAAGAALERAYATRLETPELVAQLALHYAAGGDVARALAHGLRAGDLARGVYANAEALVAYRRALAAAGDEAPDDLVDVWIAIQTGLGEVCYLVGEYDAAAAAFQAVLAALPRSARAVDERALVAAEAWRRLGNVREAQTRYDDALKCLQRAFAELGEDDPYPAEAARLYKDTAWVSIRQAQYDLAINACYIGLQLAQRAQDERVVADIDDYLGVAYEYKGDYERSIEHHQAALAIKERLADKAGMARSLSNLGTIYWLQNRFDEAREAYERSLELCTAIGHRLGMAIVLNNLGNVHFYQGRSEPSLEFYQRSLAICQQIGNLHGIALAYNNLGEVYAKVGPPESALSHLQRAAGLYAETGDRAALAGTSASLARVYAASGELAQAADLAHQALGVARDIGNRLVVADAALVLAGVYRARGEWVAARRHYEESAAIYAELGNETRAAEVAAELSRLAGTENDDD